MESHAINLILLLLYIGLFGVPHFQKLAIDFFWWNCAYLANLNDKLISGGFLLNMQKKNIDIVWHCY